MNNTKERIYKGCQLSYDQLPSAYVVLDTETTGLSPKNDHIIEIAAIKVINDEVVNQFQTLIQPPKNQKGYFIPTKITKITGIDDHMVVDAPNFSEICNELVNFIGNLPIVGHNVVFDLNFLSNSVEKYSNFKFSNNYIDTLCMARKLYPGISHTLSNLSCYLNLRSFNAHRALADVLATYECYQIMKNTIDS